MPESKYAEYFRNEPVGDFTRLYPELALPSFHIRGIVFMDITLTPQYVRKPTEQK